LDGARGDERRDSRREAAERTADDEDRETGQEDAALPAEISESAEREHETRGDELVDREREADRDDVRAELLLDDREHGDDGARIDGGEESARADRGEREPFRAAGDDGDVDATRG
jgi:hypothetical protein